MEPLASVEVPPVVTLDLEGPRPQRRWTVALRLLLAVPHWIYTFFVSIAAFVAVVAAWFACLVLGRMPDGIGTFLSRVLQYQGRVYAYGGLLLTDTFPAFRLDEPDYPVSVRAPYGGRLNRAAVFFRLVISIPAWIAVQIVNSGVMACLVFVWLIVLVAGRMPRSLFEALASVLRYNIRTYAYFGMLTSEYPRGLFGDRGLAADEAAPATVTTDEVAAATPAVTTHEAAPTTPTMPPRITKLVLSKAAKRIIVLFIVIGVIVSVVGNIAQIASLDDERARREVRTEYGQLVDATQAWSAAVQRCASSGAGLACVRAAAGGLAAAVAEFRDDLGAIKMPGGALGEAEDVDQVAAALVGVLSAMAEAPDGPSYDALVPEFQRLTEELDRQAEELDTALLFS